ncbi:hypothetical protein C8A05DRAFT_32732 [Staphylotrichum tortipilum]|uniref:Uncharacterized protein n=1 Tax=Staphylotrichum tortipilum TaxID=2831512 RepID=A0AAN6MM88_9PEZI|nr:hypothetical protein C8A05DRAFT_32732 [Staphylotrichum longicolle]
MCDTEGDTPFCSPKNGAQLLTGQTAEITWNPDFFSATSPPPTEIFVQADFTLPSNSGGSNVGFTSAPLDPNAGTFSWPILPSYLPSSANLTTVILSLAAPLVQNPTSGSFIRIGTGTVRFPGPQIRIVRSSTTTNAAAATTSRVGSTASAAAQSGTASAPVNPLAIALPVVFGVLTALAMAGYILLKRRNPRLLQRLNPFARRNDDNFSGSGYFGRGQQSLGGGVGSVRLRGRNVEIKVVKTDMEGLRANAGRMVVGGGNGRGQQGRGQMGRGNVFREEVRRQMEAEERGRV